MTNAPMSHVDGNALAGLLADLFAFDATMASLRCGSCHEVSILATTIVYMDAMGAVARCPHCDDVLLTVVESDDRLWFAAAGASAIEVPR